MKYETTLTRRLRRAIEARNTNPRALAKQAGLGLTAVADILVGRNKRPSLDVVQAIAGALQISVETLTGPCDNKHGLVPLLNEPMLRVIGVAETGSFRERGNLGVAFMEKVSGPPHPRFPDARHFALELRDFSMDRATPPIPGGAICLCVDLESARLPVEPQRIYAINRSIDGGARQELLIRRVVNNAQGMILRAESSKPEQYPDFEVPALTSDKSAAVHVIGLVYGAINLF